MVHSGMEGRMGAAAAALVCLLGLQIALLPAAAFYLPGVAPMDYKKVFAGSKLHITVSRAVPYSNTWVVQAARSTTKYHRPFITK